MVVPVHFDRCSICLNEVPLTTEHILPESIGGTLQARIQCAKCNSDLGSELVSQARQDPVLRLAIQNLRDRLPDLYLSMEEGQSHFAKDISGKGAPARLKGGRFVTKAHKREDGSLILDTREGEQNIRQLLSKEGLAPEDVDQAMQRFRESPENTPVRLSPERVAVRWTVVSTFPSLEKSEMSPRLVALMAYNYLCLLFDQDVLNPWFDFVRRFIREGVSDDRLKIQTFTSRKYNCFHRLHPEFGSGQLKIHLVLFGWLIYVVEITGLVVRAPQTVYIEDLENKRVVLAESIDHLRRGEWHTNKPLE
jgi:hypothetical protein